MSLILNIVKKENVNIGFQLIILLIPIILTILVFYNVDWLDYFDNIQGYDYKYYSVFVMFMLLSISTVFINLVNYILSQSKFIFYFRGENRKILLYEQINKALLIILTASIVSFVAMVLLAPKVSIFSFSLIKQIYGFLSISIFVIFLASDIIMIRCEKLSITKGTYAVKNENKSLFYDSVWLINIPILVFLVTSTYFSHYLDINGYYGLKIDKITASIPFLVECPKDYKQSFLAGVDTGVTLTSIIISQVIYFVLKIKWKAKAREHNKTIKFSDGLKSPI